MKKGILSIAAVLLILGSNLMYTSCKKDSSSNPPAVPSENAFVMDFSDFSVTKKGTGNVNFPAALQTVAFWQSVMNGVIAIPVAAFREAAKHEAKYVENNTWEWTYTITYGVYSLTSKLTGTIASDSAEWKMYITLTGGNIPVDNFLWFYGKSALDGTGGYWILNESPAIPEPVLRADWTKGDNNTFSLKYTYVKAGQDATGNSIEFGKTSDNGAYNAYYIIRQAGVADPIVQIEWNTTTKAGHIMSYTYFQDNVWHCWDATMSDAVCN